ncbi:MAG: hypothetical protein L0Y56_02780 [Nitrospira sp.]|nr:hypothetical protein [Nitrospira sp.]
MKKIYEAKDAPEIPNLGHGENRVRVPNMDFKIGESDLRLHFYPEGIVFGLHYPGDPRMAIVMDYEAIRRIMLKELDKENREKEEDN